VSGLAEGTACEDLAARWEASLAGVVRGAWRAEECAELTARVLAARDQWTADFGGEQFTLGRAFYTHLETGRAGEYFAAVRGADALVERVLPGVQARVRADFGRAVGGVARARLGFCGPGVHVFPAGSKVARAGGVAHWDVEGIAPLHLARPCRAASLVLMLQPGEGSADLTLWHETWNGRDEPTRRALSSPRETLRYGVGDLAVFSSYRLHRIEPFGGAADRVSLTVHGVEVDPGVWETWF
jgi:hypothetical protein